MRDGIILLDVGAILEGQLLPSAPPTFADQLGAGNGPVRWSLDEADGVPFDVG